METSCYTKQKGRENFKEDKALSLGCLKWRRLATSNAEEGHEEPEFSVTVCESVVWCTILENSLVIAVEVKHAFILWPSSYLYNS